MGCRVPSHPVPKATHPRAQSRGWGWTAPSGGLDKPIHFPSLSGSGEAAPTLITWWFKKKKLGAGSREGWPARAWDSPTGRPIVPPPVAPNKYLQGTPGLVALAATPHTLPEQPGQLPPGAPAGARRLRFQPSPALWSICSFRQISHTGASASWVPREGCQPPALMRMD